jgi:hypothetical protein
LIGVADAMFYLWKKKYANLGVLELRDLLQVRIPGSSAGSVAKFEIPPRLGILPGTTQTAKRR